MSKRVVKTGIYKITSPTGKIYIGQSVDIERRWRDHKQTTKNSKGNKLILSFLEFGYSSHTFKVEEECSKDLLKERERYYQDFYNVLGENGLNHKLNSTSDKPAILSDDYKKKMSDSGKARKPISDETRLKLSITSKGRVSSLETREKIRVANIGRTVSQETRLKISLTLKNKTK